MKRFALSVTSLLLIVWALRAEIVTNDAHCLSIQPYTATYNYRASAPIDIQVEGFSLVTDSGSLKYSLDIQASKLPYKSGVAMRSNMENVQKVSNLF